MAIRPAISFVCAFFFLAGCGWKDDRDKTTVCDKAFRGGLGESHYPNTQTMNAAVNSFESDGLIYQSDGKWLLVYDSVTRRLISKEKHGGENIKLLSAGKNLVVFATNELSLYEMHVPSLPRKIGSTELTGDFVSARSISDRVIVVTAKNIHTKRETQFPIDIPPESPCYQRHVREVEKKFYETQITSFSLSDLTDSVTLKFTGNVSSLLSEREFTFTENLVLDSESGGRITRVLNVLPDGLLGELRTLVYGHSAVEIKKLRAVPSGTLSLGSAVTSD